MANYRSTSSGRWAIVTGASSGIGLEYARQLALRRGWNLMLVARRLDRLEALRHEITTNATGLGVRSNPPIVELFCADITDPNSRLGLFKRCEELGIAAELLVNNAGFGSVSEFAAADPQCQCRMVELNCIAPLHLTHLFLESCCVDIPERNGLRGAVINVSSTASFQPLPYMATYAATKAFLTSFSVALNTELRRKGVLVLAHCPGPTESEFHLVAGLQQKMTHLPGASAESVVAEALSALDRRSGLVINGRLNGVLARLARVLPLSWSASLAERVLRSDAQEQLLKKS